MPRRDEDDIDIMSGLSVDRDDARYRQRTNQGPAPGSSNGNARSREAEVVAKKGSGLGTTLVIITLLLVCAALSYQVWNVSQQTRITETALSEATKRIDQINRELFATGSTVLESSNVVEEKFKFFDSEIRKLWDVSYKRNKGAIEEHEKEIKSLTADLKKVSESFKSSETKQSALAKEQGETSSKLKQMNTQLLAENTTLRASLEDHTEQLLMLRGELELLQTRLKDMPKDLGKRLKTNEEAIEAIDAARRQLVANITLLQNRVDQIQGK